MSNKKNKTAESKSNTKERKGLSSAEKRELEALPKQIEEAEALVSQIESQMEEPIVASNYNKLKELTEKRNAAIKNTEALFRRWEELESK